MKVLNNIRLLSIMGLIVLSFSSCLKDPRFVDFSSSPPLVEFPLAGFNNNKTTVIGPAGVYAAKAADGNYTLTVAVNLASADVLNEAVSYTVAIDNSTLTGTPSATKPTTAQLTPATTTSPIPSMAPLPAADYTVVSGLTGSIPAGQRLAYITVTVNGTLVGNATKNYALRFVITSASKQISNYNALVYCFQFQ